MSDELKQLRKLAEESGDHLDRAGTKYRDLRDAWFKADSSDTAIEGREQVRTAKEAYQKAADYDYECREKYDDAKLKAAREVGQGK
jgi:hypothetical protein